MGHYIPTDPPADWVSRGKWEFNGDMDKPTFSPSILSKWPGPGSVKICHSFVRDGKIQFLADCTHDLKGQTVDLPDVALGS